MNSPPPPAGLDASKRAHLSLGQRLARVWPYFSNSPGAWALAIGATVVASATEPFVPALLKPLLDQGFQPGGLDLWLVPVTLVLLFTVRGVSGFLAQYALALVANDGLQALRKAMFDKLLTAQLSLFEQQTTSAISNTLVYEVYNGASILSNAVMKLARDVLTLLALVAYLLFLNWKLMLIVSLLFPAVALVIQLLTRRLYRLATQSQQATDALAYVVEENVLAHRDVRLYGAQAAQAGRFEVLSASLRRLSMKSTAAYASMSAITQVMAAIALSAVISIALLQGSENTTTVGGFVAFVTAMLLLIAPIKGLSDGATPITRGLAALERGLDLLDLTTDERGGSFSKTRASGAIEFRRVSVLYQQGATPALTEVSLSVAAGQTLALVGASGSGKTTLVNLLPRFVDATSGGTFLDGTDISQWTLASLREQFAVVSQHVVMLNDSLSANVILGKPFDADKVAHCLAAANLAQLVADLPLGLDTMLGHNAMQLSGGQRQRLAIARALYKDAPILVLDEATSALDNESERAVQDALARLMKGRTTLVIAHRLSTIQHADQIVVMVGGQIEAAGTHEALLKQSGTYARLYHLASGGVSNALFGEAAESPNATSPAL
jgi:ATP-binding cassette, subfamily B, bacterial MsbA